MGSAPWSPSKALPYDLTALPRPPADKAMTFACRAHGMTSFLTQQTFGGSDGGGDEGRGMT